MHIGFITDVLHLQRIHTLRHCGEHKIAGGIGKRTLAKSGIGNSLQLYGSKRKGLFAEAVCNLPIQCFDVCL